MSNGYAILGAQLLVDSSPGSGDPFDAFEQSDDADWRRFEENKFSIGEDNVGAVPPYQVLQQQNAGLPPGSIPPWYAMQYPAGYVPPLLISVDNPLEGDPFDNFELLTRHHDEREQRDLRRSHLIGLIGADLYDVANITRAFNAVFYDQEARAKGYLRPRTLTVADIEPLAKLANKAIDNAIRCAPRGVFIEEQNTARNTVKGKIDWHLKNLATIKKERGKDAPYPSSDDFRQWAISAFVECNAAMSAAQYASERVSLYKETIDQLKLLGHHVGKAGSAIMDAAQQGLEQGVASLIPWWVWAVGGVVVLGAGAYMLMPFVIPMLARTAALTGSARASISAIRG